MRRPGSKPAGCAKLSFRCRWAPVGGGNHFAELQKVNAVMDAEPRAPWGLRRRDVCSCWCTAARGACGDAILRAQVARSGAGGIAVDSEEGPRRTWRRTRARWPGRGAQFGRSSPERMASRMGSRCVPCLDVCHNAVCRTKADILHRKGAAPHGGWGRVPTALGAGTCDLPSVRAAEGDGKA